MTVTHDEVSRLTACDASHVPQAVTELGRDRLFLLRTNASPLITWRDSGFLIPPHD